MVEVAAQRQNTNTLLRTTADGGARPLMEDLTPTQIVEELDRYVIGQNDAKRAVAVALRNRFRRQLLPDDIRQEIQPKNILMIGPTGVGKTEIARRVAKIVDAPFLKVEATKFTEVGYVGRDVESIVRDLVEISIDMLHGQRLEAVKEEATGLAVQRLADILVEQVLNQSIQRRTKKPTQSEEQAEEQLRRAERTRERRAERERQRILQLLADNKLEDETVEIELETNPEFDDAGELEFEPGMSPDDVNNTIGDFFERFMPRRALRRRVSVKEARRILTQQESDRMVDLDAVIDEAIHRVEEAGVVFIDEIDKTISSDAEVGGDVSSEGVQRDLLPIVEGSVVMTRYGPVRTDHVLFVAAGSFHDSRPSDLIPELQGRFPIRVELNSLSEDDLYAILTEPKNAQSKQYQWLLGTEGLELIFAEDGLREISRLASLFNTRLEDIGARRLQTILEKVVEEISFNAPAYKGQTIVIDAALVNERIGDIQPDEDLSEYIL
jgi:ATP-dependent HslUV protease ATP-binding subunit HslU